MVIVQRGIVKEATINVRIKFRGNLQLFGSRCWSIKNVNIKINCSRASLMYIQHPGYRNNFQWIETRDKELRVRAGLSVGGNPHFLSSNYLPQYNGNIKPHELPLSCDCVIASGSVIRSSSRSHVKRCQVRYLLEIGHSNVQPPIGNRT